MVPCKYLTWLRQDLISALEVWIYVMTDSSGDSKHCDGLSTSSSQDRHHSVKSPVDHTISGECFVVHVFSGESSRQR